MEWQHVYPVSDTKDHDIEGTWKMFDGVHLEAHPFCGCLPEIDWDNRIVIHNAWDLREAQEFINKEPLTMFPEPSKYFNKESEDYKNGHQEGFKVAMGEAKIRFHYALDGCSMAPNSKYFISKVYKSIFDEEYIQKKRDPY